MDRQAPNQTVGSPREEVRELIDAGAAVPRELVKALTAEVDSLRDQLALSGTFEEGYVIEIQRMNALVLELADYVDTIADAVSDSLGSDEITAHLRRQVAKLILQSTQAMRTSEKQ